MSKVSIFLSHFGVGNPYLYVATITRFEDLQVWQKARHLLTDIHRLVSIGKMSKDFVFKDQLWRAALSIMNNIAEGFARRTDREFSHFLSIARGSVTEIQSMLYAAMDLGYVSKEQFDSLYAVSGEISKMTFASGSYLRGGLDRPST